MQFYVGQSVWMGDKKIEDEMFEVILAFQHGKKNGRGSDVRE